HCNRLKPKVFPFLFPEQRLVFLYKFLYSQAFHEHHYSILVIQDISRLSISLEADPLAVKLTLLFLLFSLQYVHSYILLSISYYFHSRRSTNTIYTCCYILLRSLSVSYPSRSLYLQLITHHISH